MAEKLEKQTENISITKQDLADIVTAAIAAAKAPNVIEQQKFDAMQAELAQKQEYWKATSQSVRDEMEQKKQTQTICSHEHPNGASRSVFVTERSGPGYMLCVWNQCKIRPEPKPKRPDPGAIYDTQLFNKMLQKSYNQDIFQ